MTAIPAITLAAEIRSQRRDTEVVALTENELLNPGPPKDQGNISLF